MEPKKTKTIQELNEQYCKTYYLEDTMVIPLLAAIIITSKAPGFPIWLYLIGPSSGGKTTLINVFSKVPFAEQVSDLTPNTFLSGMKNSKNEPSLLLRLGRNFIIFMKDFTTILSKSKESQEAIIGQMREIYDGHIVKYTGTGDKIEWGPKGKATFIMASTEGIYTVQERFSDMGTRAINYVLKPQDRIKTTKRALNKNATADAEMSTLQDDMKDYILDKVNTLPESFDPLQEEFEDEIIEISDFSSICRSVVNRDYRGEKNLALSSEMPMRMAHQLRQTAQGLIWLYDGKITQDIKDAVFKIGLDSIPKQRKLVLEVLARYNRVDVSGVATEINYNVQRSREWIEDLNMHGICDRIRSKDKEWWEMKPQYKAIMRKYMGVESTGETLEGKGDSSWSGGEDIDWEVQEQNKVMNQQSF